MCIAPTQCPKNDKDHTKLRLKKKRFKPIVMPLQYVQNNTIAELVGERVALNTCSYILHGHIIGNLVSKCL